MRTQQVRNPAYFDVLDGPERVVRIVAVGLKDGDRVMKTIDVTDANNPEFLAIVERSRVSLDAGKSITTEGMRRRLGLRKRKPR